MKHKPLAGKRILVTRPKGQSAELAALLRRDGARVLAVPAIRIRPPADPKPLREAARRFAEGAYDWVVFTSPNSVRRFLPMNCFARASAGEGGAKRRMRAHFAAIGPKTAAELKSRGVKAVTWPDEHRAEALEKSLKVKRGDRVLLPRAAVARDVLPDRLKKRGAKVDIVEAYRTEPDPKSRARLRRLLLGDAPPDWITFTSSSTAQSLRDLFSAAEWKRVLARCRAASIGPITSATLRSLGAKPAAQAEPYTARGLAAAIREAES